MDIDTAGRLAAVGTGIVLYAAHQVADHWGQCDRMAAAKPRPTRRGQAACAAHVAIHGIVTLAALAAVAAVTGWRPAPAGVATAVALIVVTHYIADRRWPLAILARIVGAGGFWALGRPRAGHDDAPHIGTGAYALDQAWHVTWLAAAALILAAAS